MNEQKKKVFRTKYLIYPGFQLKFIGFVIFGILVTLTIVYISLNYHFNVMQSEGMLLNLPENHFYFKLISYQKDKMLNIFIFSGLGMSGFLFIFGLLLSHRVAGPLVKLSNFLKAYTRGENPGEYKLRKNDFFQEIATNFNEFIKKKS